MTSSPAELHLTSSTPEYRDSFQVAHLAA